MAISRRYRLMLYLASHFILALNRIQGLKTKGRQDCFQTASCVESRWLVDEFGGVGGEHFLDIRLVVEAESHLAGQFLLRLAHLG